MTSLSFSDYPIKLERFYDRLARSESAPAMYEGYVSEITGMIVKAKLPNARIGELCGIRPPGGTEVSAQVVGFEDETVFLTAIDRLQSVGLHNPVVNYGSSLRIPVGEAMLGRVVNALGEPIDGKGKITAKDFYPVHAAPPKALDRKRITNNLALGVRSIDTLLPVGEGQRVGIFSVAGVGKSSLLGMIARNSTADVNVVAMIGERGREVNDFLEDCLGEEGLKRSVVVVSTSDEPSLKRITAAYAATAIAEYFRDQGKRVTLLMDSVTRFARGLREIALSLGEPPARMGYPPSVFAMLPELFERTGSVNGGSITAFYTVLLSSEKLDDPLGEEVRAILDGHLYLSSAMARSQNFPAIDVIASNSRVADRLVSDEELALAQEFKNLWATYDDNRDLINIGAYKRGTDQRIDRAIAKRPAQLDYLSQLLREPAPDTDESFELLRELLDS